MRALLFALLLLFAGVFAAPAVEPDEILDDPALEERARDISANLRCLVCQNQSIDDSNADLARDLRLLVRERLVAGDTDAEVVEQVVARYGEFVLLTPPFDVRTLLLWAGAPLALLLAAVLIWWRNRARPAVDDASLSDEEKARLDALLKSRDAD